MIKEYYYDECMDSGSPTHVTGDDEYRVRFRHSFRAKAHVLHAPCPARPRDSTSRKLRFSSEVPRDNITDRLHIHVCEVDLLVRTCIGFQGRKDGKTCSSASELLCLLFWFLC
jgi:hypothetical protein